MNDANKPRAVLDSTVYYSALARNGVGAQKVLEAWRQGKFSLCASNENLEEAARVLSKADSPAEATPTLFAEIRRKAIIVEPTEEITIWRDANDNHILAAAVAGAADYIVTDDKDLRVLSPFRGIEIITVNRFLRRLGIRRRKR